MMRHVLPNDKGCAASDEVVKADGAVSFSKNYMSCGGEITSLPNACGTNLIKNECWGLTLTPDGGSGALVRHRD